MKNVIALICQQTDAHCRTCRDPAGGRAWRLDLTRAFDVPPGGPDFPCPLGRPWGYAPMALPAAPHPVAAPPPRRPSAGSTAALKSARLALCRGGSLDGPPPAWCEELEPDGVRCGLQFPVDVPGADPPCRCGAWLADPAASCPLGRWATAPADVPAGGGPA
jgi:hypothetical protein